MKRLTGHEQKRLIVLSPGWGSVLGYLKDSSFIEFREAGYDVAILEYLNAGLGSIRSNAMKVHSVLDDFLTKDSYEHVTFIGHSMGGLIGRYLLQYVKVDYINALVTLGTPHNGIPLAGLVSKWSDSAKEMKLNSEFIKELNSLSPPSQPTLAVTGGLDYITKASTLEWAENISIPKKTHLSLVLSQRTYLEVFSWLTYEIHGENGPYSNRKGDILQFSF